MFIRTRKQTRRAGTLRVYALPGKKMPLFKSWHSIQGDLGFVGLLPVKPLANVVTNPHSLRQK